MLEREEAAGKGLRGRLRDEGVVLLGSVFPRGPLMRLREAAVQCFKAIESGRSVPERYRFTRAAHSVLLTALLDFGVDGEEALLAPLRADGLDDLFSDLVGGRWHCRLAHSWARKKFAPRNAPESEYYIQNWHQDGALGVQFPPAPVPTLTATNLATCWIPLNACGRESPGLEFIRKPKCATSPELLHFTELDDAVIRRRFEGEAFWAPTLEPGDGLVFRNDVLHRTHVHAAMSTDRMSVEYRIFPEKSQDVHRPSEPEPGDPLPG